MQLSVVTTLYRSVDYIEEFHRRMTAVARQLAGDDYEIIFVNDGSPDNSLDVAKQLANTDRHLTIVDLSKNFGHHMAMICGLQQASGERIFLIDSDLEEDPAWLESYWAKMNAEECDSVFGMQRKRKGGFFERVSGWVFYTLYNVLTGFNFPRNIVTARLMTRPFLDAFLSFGERELSIGGLFFITGFNQQGLFVTKSHSSPSTYTLGRKFAVLVNSVVSFSSKPLVVIFSFGLIVFLLSFAVSAYYVINAFFLSQPPSGWTSLMISVWMLGGLIISSIGVVGIYISKVYAETKQRPRIIIRDIIKYQKEMS